MTFFPVLLYLLSAGLLLTLFRVPYWEIGSRFYKLITYLSLIGWTIILLVLDPDTIEGWIFFSLILTQIIIGLTHLIALKTGRHSVRNVSYWICFIVVLWTILAVSIWPPGHRELSYRTPAFVLFVQFGLTSGILGAVVNAMICGHWYLVNEFLSLEPIETITNTLNGLIILKAAMVVGLFGYFYAFSHETVRQLLAYYPLLVGVRIVAGLLFGWLLNWMAWKTLEYENTQAATGILYACITFIIMGEFSAYYLTVHTGIAL